MIAYRTMTSGRPVRERPVPVYVEEIEVERFTEQSVWEYPTGLDGERFAGCPARRRDRSNRFDTIHETKAAAIQSLTATREREIQDAERRVATAREHLAVIAGLAHAEFDAGAAKEDEGGTP